MNNSSKKYMYVFKRVQKTGSDGTDVTCCGRLFQIRTAARRLEKLGRRRLRVEYGEQTARETKRNADAFETPTPLDDEVHRRRCQAVKT